MSYFSCNFQERLNEKKGAKLVSLAKKKSWRNKFIGLFGIHGNLISPLSGCLYHKNQRPFFISKANKPFKGCYWGNEQLCHKYFSRQTKIKTIKKKTLKSINSLKLASEHKRKKKKKKFFIIRKQFCHCTWLYPPSSWAKFFLSKKHSVLDILFLIESLLSILRPIFISFHLPIYK